jgi:hypothetical protein
MISIKIKDKEELNNIDNLYIEHVETHYKCTKNSIFDIDFYEVFFKEEFKELINLIFKEKINE